MTQYRTVMVATDFSPLAVIAHEAAIQIAKAVGTKRIHFEHVVQISGNASAVSAAGYPFSDWEIDKIFEAGLEDARSKLAAIRVEIPGVEITRHARIGLLGPELAKAAEQVQADLVVVASHGYGLLKRTFLGSAASALVRACHAPVLVVGEQRRATVPFGRVLAALDMSNASEKVLEQAIAMAGKGGEVQVVSLYEYPLVAPGDHDVLPRYITREEIERFGSNHAARVQALVDRVPHEGVTVRVQVMAKAPASQVILDLADMTETPLIVVGTSGHSAWHRMMIGSTATRVLNEAKHPVLVVPFDVK